MAARILARSAAESIPPAKASRSDPALRERYAELRSELYEGLIELLLARRDEVGHPDPVLATGFVLDQLGSMLQTRLDEMLLPKQLANRSDEEFVREALRSACAYLQVDPPIEVARTQGDSR